MLDGTVDLCRIDLPSVLQIVDEVRELPLFLEQTVLRSALR